MRCSLKHEKQLRAQGFSSIAGIDEAGRGPLAGPVVAAAAMLPEKFRHKTLRDSKQLSARQRKALYDELKPLGIHATVVEPGYFRTDFLDGTSLQPVATRIDDYAATAGAVREHAEALNHRQPGDPERLAGALIALVDAKEPPLRLPLGSDAVARIEEKNAFVARELDAWRKLASSTDFPKGT